MAIKYFTKKDDRGIHVMSASTVPKYGFVSSHPAGEIYMSKPAELPNFWGSHQQITRDFVRENPGKEAPTELFTHRSPQIDRAYVDPAIRHTLPTMVMLGMQQMGAEHDTPMADSSLSPYSSKLSRAASTRGLAVPHPDNPDMSTEDHYNSDEYDMDNMYEDMPDRTISARAINEYIPKRMDVVSPEDVQRARTALKNRLRKPKPDVRVSRGTNQFEQLSLGF